MIDCLKLSELTFKMRNKTKTSERSTLHYISVFW